MQLLNLFRGGAKLSLPLLLRKIIPCLSKRYPLFLSVSLYHSLPLSFSENPLCLIFFTAKQTAYFSESLIFCKQNVILLQTFYRASFLRNPDKAAQKEVKLSATTGIRILQPSFCNFKQRQVFIPHLLASCLLLLLSWQLSD